MYADPRPPDGHHRQERGFPVCRFPTDLLALLNDHEQAETYYRQFLDLAEREPANDKLSPMIQQAKAILKIRELKKKKGSSTGI